MKNSLDPEQEETIEFIQEVVKIAMRKRLGEKHGYCPTNWEKRKYRLDREPFCKTCVHGLFHALNKGGGCHKAGNDFKLSEFYSTPEEEM